MAKKEYSVTNKKFVNPYHFIPLEEHCERNISYKELRKQENLKTGWIECELETLTPVFIPNTTDDGRFKEGTIKSYDFYSYDDLKSNKTSVKPVIPGSSIRGTIRSVFETLTNSCMSTTDENHVLYKRVTSPAEPGILNYDKIKNVWQVTKCEKYMLKTGVCDADPSPIHEIEDYSEGELVYFEKGERYKNKYYMPYVVSAISKVKTQDCVLQGYIHKGEPFPRKHHESVFVKTKNFFNVDSRTVENLLENYRLFQDESINLHKKQKNHNGYVSNMKNAERAKLEKMDGMLIYYAKHNNRYYLSPAAIGREVFHNRLRDLIGDYAPCSSSEHLCQACALFGFAGNENSEDSNNAIASRIRFSDATTNKYAFLDPVILPELASPKESATEMYLKRPDSSANVWNYDYIIPEHRRTGGKNKRYDPKIQGRKFYWHHKNIKTFDEENKNFAKKIEYSDRLVMVRPVVKDSKFSFRVDFNQITKDELDKLLWTLSLGNSSNLAHKIGMGKPVGLGSIKIKINKVIERTIDISENNFNYELKEYKDDYVNVNLGCSKDTLDALKKMFDFKNIQKNISYPYCEDGNGDRIPENYEWFVGNRQIQGKGKGTNHVIDQNLKPINSEDISLKVIKRKEIKNNNNKRR